jgi:asparagine synthase (glutamine-hydrolysing)
MIQLQNYWSLDPERELRLSCNEDYAEAFRELFTNAVKCRLRSAFLVGVMLSGGLDSSSVAFTASQLLTESISDSEHLSSSPTEKYSGHARWFGWRYCCLTWVGYTLES